MKLVPRSECICPSCFKVIDLGRCPIVSGITGDILRKPFVFSPRSIFIEPIKGSLVQEDAHRRCYECNYLLPYNIELVYSITIPVVGDVYSGKSHYITSFINQIKNKWVSRSVQLRCLTQDVENDFIARYHTPLYDGKIPVNQTQRGTRGQNLVNKPLIYKIQILRSPCHAPITFNLMIYDTAGEDFVQINSLVQAAGAGFALNGSGFIFVVDPFTMDPVYRILQPELKSMIPGYAQPAMRHPAHEVIKGVLDILRSYRGRSDTASLGDIPIAVMISKADIFSNREAEALTDPYAYSNTLFEQTYHPEYGPCVDLADIDTINWEVSSLLNTYKQDRLLGTLSDLKNLKFFATSATGSPPKKEPPPDNKIYFSHVEPWRCLDPILWILHELKIIGKL